jgi:hypothetical protein
MRNLPCLTFLFNEEEPEYKGSYSLIKQSNNRTNNNTTDSVGHETKILKKPAFRTKHISIPQKPLKLGLFGYVSHNFSFYVLSETSDFFLFSKKFLPLFKNFITFFKKYNG